MGRSLIISQLADDTTLFLKDATQVPQALNVLSTFSKASGLHLNLNKCDLMTIHDHPLVSIEGIAIKKEVKYWVLKFPRICIIERKLILKILC